MRFEGIIPAVTTPFDRAGDVDAAALESNVRAYVDAGVHSLVATGTMGEAASLTGEERRAVVAAVVSAAGGRVPVIAGVSAGTPAAAIGLAADAADAGAEGIMLLPPLGYRGDEREIEAFYRAVAEAAGLPLMAYNNPEASGTDMGPALIARLGRRIERLVAIKECSGDVRRIPAIIARRAGARRAGRRRRLGARGLLRRGDRLGHRGGRRRAAPVRRALRALPRRRARGGARRLPPAAAARALRHDPEARAVLQGARWTRSACAGGPCRPPRLDADGRRARRAGRRARACCGEALVA